MLACVEKVSAQVRRKSWDQSNDNLVEDDVNCGNASLNEDTILQRKLQFKQLQINPKNKKNFRVATEASIVYTSCITRCNWAKRNL